MTPRSVGMAGALTLAACDANAFDARARHAAAEARADSAAAAAIPPRLVDVLSLDPYLRDDYLRTTEGASCLVQSPPGAPEERRRVRAPLPDSALVIVYVRSSTDTAPRRVEVLHRDKARDQIGVAWTADENDVAVVRWPNGLDRPPEQGVYPRGGPLPRVLRAMARRVLGLQCQRGEG